MKTFHLEIVTPEGVAFSGDAVQLSVRAVSGSMSVLAGHIPLVTALKNGECRVYEKEGVAREAECSGGMLSVTKENVRLLCTYFAFKEQSEKV
ncbi:MAG: F0F1 ATP synthase subunit epsilon [Clostridia bacterium]|nr:F0F1 ATP synthase subunit epsilon [Clostridia bacterium]